MDHNQLPHRGGVDFVSVWSGRDPLLPDRDERPDGRMIYMPSYDLDEGEASTPHRRKYNHTGNHQSGKVTRTSQAVVKAQKCRHRWHYDKDNFYRCDRCNKYQGKDGKIIDRPQRWGD